MSDGTVPKLSAVIREAIAVLAAILAAFALDAWWDQRVEEREMREALSAVSVEIRRNLDLINRAMAYNSSQQELLAEAVALSEAEIQRLDAVQLARFGNVPNFNIVTLELGAITAFIQGGYLTVLEDIDLRADLAGLPRLQKEMDEEAEVILGQGNDFNRLFANAMPIEAVRALYPLDDPEVNRGMLLAFQQDELLLRSIVQRNFFINFLYASELTASRARLAEIADNVENFMSRS
jgi:hypothetical protein